MKEEFYVGYLPKAPGSLGRWIFRLSWMLGLGGAALAAVLVFAQTPFEPSWFEYGSIRTFEGTLQLRPQPSLIVGPARYFLVAPGKHGAQTGGLEDGSLLRLRGSLIHRNEGRMIELDPGSAIERMGSGTAPGSRYLGEVTLTGEIVDTKCYFGVMNPGRGKVHRDCAARCISGGIPSGFLVRDGNGKTRTAMLAGPGKDALLEFVAEPVSIHGRLSESHGTLFLETSSGRIRRAGNN